MVISDIVNHVTIEGFFLTWIDEELDYIPGGSVLVPTLLMVAEEIDIFELCFCNFKLYDDIDNMNEQNSKRLSYHLCVT